MTAARPQRSLLCPRCRLPLPDFTEWPPENTCAACGTSFEAIAFTPTTPLVRSPVAISHAPAFGAEGASGGSEEAAGATACAQHPSHAAVANCSRCGVFVCDLCRIPLDALELCPACFDRLSREGSLAAVETQFFDASGLALTLGILGNLMSCFGIVVGPPVIFLALKGLAQRRAWREAGGRAGPIFAMVLGALQIVISIGFIALMFAGIAMNADGKKP